MLDIASFVTRNTLENYSIRYANEQKEYVADDIFCCQIATDKDKAKKYQYDISHFRHASTKRSSKAAADKVDYGVFTSNVTLDLHKMSGDIDPSDVRNADPTVSGIREDMAQLIMDRLLIDKEVEAATLVETTGNYPGALTSALGATLTWAVAGGDPVADSRLARQAVKDTCGRYANALMLSGTAWEHLRINPSLLDRVKYTSRDSLTIDIVKNLMGLDHIFVGSAKKTTSLEGSATQTLTDIWADGALFFVHNPVPSKKTVSYGIQPIHNRLYAFEWLDNERGSEDGRITVLEMGWRYVLTAGAVVSSTDGDFTAGYYLDNVY